MSKTINTICHLGETVSPQMSKSYGASPIRVWERERNRLGGQTIVSTFLYRILSSGWNRSRDFPLSFRKSRRLKDRVTLLFKVERSGEVTVGTQGVTERKGAWNEVITKVGHGCGCQVIVRTMFKEHFNSHRISEWCYCQDVVSSSLCSSTEECEVNVWRKILLFPVLKINVQIQHILYINAYIQIIHTDTSTHAHTLLAKDIKREGGTNNFNSFHIFKRHFYRCSQEETEICLCISKYFSSQCHKDVFWAFKLLKWKIGLLIPSACSVRIFVRGQVRDREREGAFAHFLRLETNVSRMKKEWCRYLCHQCGPVGVKGHTVHGFPLT